MSACLLTDNCCESLFFKKQQHKTIFSACWKNVNFEENYLSWTKRRKKEILPDLRFCFGNTQSWHSSPFTSLSSPSHPLRYQISVCILRSWCSLDCLLWLHSYTASLSAYRCFYSLCCILTPPPTITCNIHPICAFTPNSSLLTTEAAAMQMTPHLRLDLVMDAYEQVCSLYMSRREVFLKLELPQNIPIFWRMTNTRANLLCFDHIVHICIRSNFFSHKAWGLILNSRS